MSGRTPVSPHRSRSHPVGQSDVQHHDVRLQVPSQGEGLIRGARISDDAQTLLCIEECAETVANERVIIHDQDRDLQGSLVRECIGGYRPHADRSAAGGHVGTIGISAATLERRCPDRKVPNELTLRRVRDLGGSG